MTSKRGGLGRGLGALIPSAPAEPEPEHVTDTVSAGVRVEVAADPAPAEAASTQTASAETASAGTASTGTAPTGTAPTGTTPAGSAETPATPDGAGPQAVPGARFVELPVERIRANARQPRQVFDDDALAELTHSIREFGVLQPVVVRPSGADYELVMGERRLRAAEAAGLSVIPAIVRETGDDAMLRDALLENVHRAQLNPLEEAAAYQQLLQEFGGTHEELAQRLGRSRPQITNTVRLLSLPLPVQRRVAAGVLTAGHARALLGLEDADQQDEIAGRIVAEGLSVRATEELVALAASGHAAKGPSRRAQAPRFTAPAITELADKLSDVFETRVRVDLGRRKGKITVEFASVDDLERIVAVMAPSVARSVPQPAAESESVENDPT